MSEPTANLKAPLSVRLRISQDNELKRLIEHMSETEKTQLISADRAKFKHSYTKNKGRASNMKTILIRLAVDEFLEQRSSYHEED